MATTELTWPNSTNVVRTKYYPEKEILEVEFKGKKIYHYFDFPIEVWNLICIRHQEDESISALLNIEVKPLYKFKRVNGTI